MKSKLKIGVLTIGQSPRTDVTPTLMSILGPNIDLIEAGALDHLQEDELTSILPEESEPTYVSRLRTGKSTKIGKSKLMPLLQDQLIKLEKQVSVTIMLCTGDFPSLKTKKPILYPDKILKSMITAINPNGKIGLMVPLEEQKTTLIRKWNNLDVIAEAASPYEDSDVYGAAQRLKQKGATLIVMDCIGYRENHKREASQATQLPIILPQTLVARVAAEYAS